MISRRKILSRSLDNLDALSPSEEEEDIWYDKDKLCKDHIQEVLDKWTQIDDEIWAKIIVFERNRRVAKAYARAPVITINGSKHGFDGMRIGVNGFDNPMRDSKTTEAKKAIGEGFKMKMDDTGNILIKRYGKSNVYVKSTVKNPNEETVIGADILKLPSQAIQVGKSSTLFDMKKFSININREFSRSYPDRSRLERQCLSAISLVKTSDNLINCPIWILVINIVAIDMLKNKMMALPKNFTDSENNSPPSSNEDPYTTIDSQAELLPASAQKTNSSSSSSQIQKLQPAKYSNDSLYEPRPDYEAGVFVEPNQAGLKSSRRLNNNNNNNNNREKDANGKQRKKQDDPYYCGLLARIPNFIKTPKQQKKKAQKQSKTPRKISAQQISHPIPLVHQYHYCAHYPYRLYPPHHPISQSQFSLYDSSHSMIKALPMRRPILLPFAI